jgi:hypothetical protein
MIATLLVLLLLLASFSDSNHVQVRPGDQQTPPVCGAGTVPSDLVITLADQGCLVKITADGTVAFEGQTFDFDISRVRTKIGAEELEYLICEFERINYFSLKDHYREKADGCPELRTCEGNFFIATSITLNGRSKSVAHYYYSCRDRDGFVFPRELTALEKSIETVVELKRR